MPNRSRKQTYLSRKPGTNPRTGEMLVPWQDVQVLDPETPPLHVHKLVLRIINLADASGERLGLFKVRARKDATPEELHAAADLTVRSVGLYMLGISDLEVCETSPEMEEVS